MIKWTAQEYRHFATTGETPEDVSRKKALDKAAKKAVRQKYRNKIIKNEGITFRSQKEYERYYNNILRVRNGELMFFLFQIPFWLEGGVKYIADFIEVYPAWQRIDFIDTKGFRTREYINKKKQTESRYGIKIIEI
jgi:uncharacterized protein YecE (DUF72 family)